MRIEMSFMEGLGLDGAGATSTGATGGESPCHYRWLELCAKPRLRAKSLKDYEGLLRRYVRPGLGPKALPSISAFDLRSTEIC